MFGGKRILPVETEEQPKQRRIEVLENVVVNDPWDINGILGLSKNPAPPPSREETSSILSQLCELIPMTPEESTLQTPVTVPAEEVAQPEVEDVFIDEEVVPQPTLPALKLMSMQITTGAPRTYRFPQLSLRGTPKNSSALVAGPSHQPSPRVEKVKNQPQSKRTVKATPPSTQKPRIVRGVGRGKNLSDVLRATQVDGDSDIEEEESVHKIIADTKKRFKKLKGKNEAAKEKTQQELVKVKEEIQRMSKEVERLQKKEQNLESKLEGLGVEGRQIDTELQKICT